jgi:mRNA interferase MazF
MKNDIVLVPFPFDDFRTLKVRPALCLTANFGKYHHVVIAFISSNLKLYDESSDIMLKSDNTWFEATGLITDSVIKLNRIVTIPSDLIKRKLGYANPLLVKVIKNQLKEIFELD